MVSRTVTAIVTASILTLQWTPKFTCSWFINNFAPFWDGIFTLVDGEFRCGHSGGYLAIRSLARGDRSPA